MINKYMQLFFSPGTGGTPGGGNDSVPVDQGGELLPADLGTGEESESGIVFKPRTRYEHFVARLAGDPNALELTPKARWELFMAKLAGAKDVPNVSPMVREEFLLNEFVSEKTPIESEAQAELPPGDLDLVDGKH